MKVWWKCPQLNVFNPECDENVLNSKCDENVLNAKCHENVLNSKCHENVINAKCHENVCDWIHWFVNRRIRMPLRLTLTKMSWWGRSLVSCLVRRCSPPSSYSLLHLGPPGAGKRYNELLCFKLKLWLSKRKNKPLCWVFCCCWWLAFIVMWVKVMASVTVSSTDHVRLMLTFISFFSKVI